MKQSMFKDNKVNLTMTIITTFFFVALNVMIGYMIKIFTESLEFKDVNLLEFGTRLVLIYFVLFFITSKLRKRYFSQYITTASRQLKDFIFAKVLGKSIAEYEASESGQLISTLSNDMTILEEDYLAGITTIAYNLFIVLLASAALIFMNPKYGSIIVGIAIVLLCLALLRKNKLKEDVQKTSDRNKIFLNQVKDILNGFVVIKSFNAEKNLLKIFQEKNKDLEESKLDKTQTQQDITLSSNMASIILNISVFSFGYWFVFRGDMTLGVIMGSIQVANYLMDPIRNLGPALTSFLSAKSLLERLDEELQTEPVELAEMEAVETEPLAFKDAIKMMDVNFSYGEKPVLSQVDYCFEKNKKYAIVGLSGSGKTTLLELLLGYLPNYDGTIYYDDRNLTQIDLAALYREVSVLQQDVFLFDSSLEDNITMFNHYPEDVLRTVIKEAGLENLVQEKGLDYAVGERGENLSGGEMQRVSIARALIRNTPIIMMDEPTASLDQRTAHDIESAILNLQDCLIISVTHSYQREIMELYDDIIVLKDGQIEETGTFRELLAAKGYFYSLYTLTK